MEILKKIFLTVFILIVLLYVGISVFLLRNGKDLIEEKLSQALQKEVHAGKASLMFPLGLRFDDLRVEDVLTAKAFRVRLGIPLFLDRRLNMTKIKLTDPVIFLSRSRSTKTLSLGKPGTTTIQTTINEDRPRSDVKNTEKSPGGVIIDYLEINNGKVEFWDQDQKDPVVIGQVNVKAMDVPLPPRDLKTKFDLKAVILSEHAPFSGQKIEAWGTVNATRRDMDSKIKIVDRAGKSSFSGHFKSVNNDMIVKGQINVGRFVSGMKTMESRESGFEGFLASALESSGVDIGVNFTCQTKMDEFHCEKIGLSGNVVQTSSKSP